MAKKHIAMITDLFDNLFRYTTAIKLINKHGLWRYIVIPGLISVAVFGILVVSTFSWLSISHIGEWVANSLPEWMPEFIGTALEYFLDYGGAYIILLGIIAFLYFYLGKYIILIIVAPFMGPLSEKVESIVRGKLENPNSNFVQDFLRGLRISIRNMIYELFLSLAFLLLHLIPVIGSLAAAILTFVFEAYFAGFGNMDYTLERKQFTVRDSVRFVRKNSGIAIGNGAVFILMLLIPVAGWFLAPAFATVAATVSTLKRMETQGI